MYLDGFEELNGHQAVAGFSGTRKPGEVGGLIDNVLSSLLPSTHVIAGCAKGVDAVALSYAGEMGFRTSCIKATGWSKRELVARSIKFVHTLVACAQFPVLYALPGTRIINRQYSTSPRWQSTGSGTFSTALLAHSLGVLVYVYSTSTLPQVEGNMWEPVKIGSNTGWSCLLEWVQ